MSDIASNYTSALGMGSTLHLAGELDLDEVHRNRMERDLIELQEMINTHFQQRKQDDEELEMLKVQGKCCR